MKRQWKVALTTVAVAAVGLSVVAVASGATGVKNAFRGDGACATVMSDPETRASMQELRAEHRSDMRAWLDQYGAKRSSAEAQDALKALRSEHWDEMRALLGQAGVTVPDGAGSGAGGGCGGAGGGCGGPGGQQGAGYGGMMGGASY